MLLTSATSTSSRSGRNGNPMSATAVKSITPRELKAALHDGGEIALLDAREERPFGARHHLMATCVPLSRLELMLDDLVPRRAARVVWCDDGEGVAARAAQRSASSATPTCSVLDGGLKAWEARRLRASTAASMCRARRSPRWSSTRRRRLISPCTSCRRCSTPRPTSSSTTAARSRNITTTASRPRPACPAPSWSIASPIWRRRPTRSSSSTAAAARAASSARSR